MRKRFFKIIILKLYLVSFVISPKWVIDLSNSTNISFPFFIFPKIIELQERIYILASLWQPDKGGIAFYDPEEKSTKWIKRFDSQIYYGFATYKERDKIMIMAGNYKGDVVVIDPSKGQIKRSFRVAQKIRDVLLADLTGDSIFDLVAIEGDFDLLEVFDGETQRKMWDLQCEGKNSLHSTAFKRGKLYTHDGAKILCLDPLTGKNLWIRDLGSQRVAGIIPFRNIVSRLIVEDTNGDGEDEIIAITWFGEVYFFSLAGELLKKGGVGSKYLLTAVSAIDVNGDTIQDIILASTSHYVFTLDGNTLGLIWKFRAPYELYEAPAVFKSEGNTFVVIVSRNEKGTRGYLFLVEGKTGKLLLKYEIEDEFDEAGYALVADVDYDGYLEFIVKGSMTGKLYVLGTSIISGKGEVFRADR